MFYRGKHVLITGGAGFIGSTLTDKLIQLGAKTTIGDNLSSGSLSNILRIWRKNNLKYKKTSKGYTAEDGHKFVFVDFEHFNATLETIKNHEIVFHLAANIGGRGYIETHPADCCGGFAINQNVIRAAHLSKVDRVQFASSACVYPQDLQNEYGSKYLLKEEDAMKNKGADPDQEYGWAKLMGEIILNAYVKQYGLKGASTRYVTVYGPWENDTHAIIALIRKAVEKQDPFVVWGSGKQDRDFTFVEDIISGTLAICEKVTDGQAINLGTGKRYTIPQVLETIFAILGWKPKKIVFDATKPEGVKSRALNISKAKKTSGWQPKYNLATGLKETIDWFIKEKPQRVETLV